MPWCNRIPFNEVPKVCAARVDCANNNKHEASTWKVFIFISGRIVLEYFNTTGSAGTVHDVPANRRAWRCPRRNDTVRHRSDAENLRERQPKPAVDCGLAVWHHYLGDLNLLSRRSDGTAGFQKQCYKRRPGTVHLTRRVGVVRGRLSRPYYNICNNSGSEPMLAAFVYRVVRIRPILLPPPSSSSSSSSASTTTTSFTSASASPTATTFATSVAFLYSIADVNTVYFITHY